MPTTLGSMLPVTTRQSGNSSPSGLADDELEDDDDDELDELDEEEEDKLDEEEEDEL